MTCKFKVGDWVRALASQGHEGAVAQVIGVQSRTSPDGPREEIWVVVVGKMLRRREGGETFAYAHPMPTWREPAECWEPTSNPLEAADE